MRLDFRFQHSGFRFRFDGFPFTERTSLGRHAELGPGRASALAAAARGVECLCVPFGAGAAGGFAPGEDFGRACREAAASEVVSRKSKRIRLRSKIQNMLWDVQNTKLGGVIGNIESYIRLWNGYDSPLIVKLPLKHGGKSQHSIPPLRKMFIALSPLKYRHFVSENQRRVWMVE